MQSKNKKSMTQAERDHVEKVKSVDCAVCDNPPPTEAHEIKQGQWFTSCSLCPECHRGPIMGLHGQKRAWTIRKMDELDALAITIQRVIAA